MEPCCPTKTRSTRSPNAVDIAFSLVRQFEIEHMGDAVHIDAPGRDIGRDQHPDIAGFEPLEGPLPCALGFVAVDRLGRDAGPVESFGDPVGAVLGARKHDHALQRGVGQNGFQQGFLAAGRYVIDPLVDGFDRRRLGRDLDPDRVRQDFARQGRDLARHGGGKQQGLALLRHFADDFPYVVDEAHIEHPVGFVEHEIFDRVERYMSLAHEIEQTARSGDDDFNAARQSGGLRFLADAAEDHGLAQMQMLAIGAEFLADLDRQFAGRRHDQRARAARSVIGAVLRKLMQNGQRKGARLAGAGLGDAQNILAGEQLGNGLGLNGGWGFVVSFGQRTLDRIGQAEFREFTDVHLDILTRRISSSGVLDAARIQRFALIRARPERVIFMIVPGRFAPP